MSDTIVRYLGRGAVLALLWMLIPVQSSEAAGWSYSGDWLVDEDINGNMLRSERHVLSGTLGQDITSTFSLDEFLRYNYTYRELGSTKETISPGMMAFMFNDLFAMDLAISTLQTIRGPESEQNNERLELNLDSRWKSDWWPVLSASVGRTNNYDSLDPRIYDRSEDHLDGVVDWKLNQVFLYYNYRWNEYTNNITNQQNGHESHLGTLSASESFLNNRLRASFSQEYNQETYKRATGSGAGIITRVISRARYGIDPLPAAAPFIPDIDVPLLF